MPASDMRGLPCHGKFQMEGGSASYLAFDLDLAGVLLDNAVAHCKSQPGAARAVPR